MGRTRRQRKCRVITNKIVDENLVNLLKWLNWKDKRLRIYQFMCTGRGIQCRKTIKSGDVLTKIPLKYLISSENFQKSELLHYLKVDETPNDVILSFLLLGEVHMQSESFYHSYLKMLPTEYSCLYFCQEKEITKLPEFLKIPLQLQKLNIQSKFKKAMDILKYKTCDHCGLDFADLFLFDNYVWAYFTVNTRSVYYQREDVKTIALVPFLDMFNHSEEAAVEVEVTNDMYVLKTLRPFQKYNQVFIKYGAHSNLTLLFEYGFLLNDNPHDSVSFGFQDVVSAAASVSLAYGDISKLKYYFIKKNNLNNNLWKNREGFSWNLKGLVYTLISCNSDFNLLTCKVYSQEFTAEEAAIVTSVCSAAVVSKLQQLQQELTSMSALQDTTISFQLATQLVKKHVQLLTSVST